MAALFLVFVLVIDNPVLINHFSNIIWSIKNIIEKYFHFDIFKVWQMDPKLYKQFEQIETPEIFIRYKFPCAYVQKRVTLDRNEKTLNKLLCVLAS